MSRTLTPWQSYLLFIPLVISTIINIIPHQNLYHSQISFAIGNVLLILTLCLVLSYQAILAFTCLEQVGKELIFKVYVLIPVVFFWIYLFYICYKTFMSNNIHNPKFVHGPVRIASMNLSGWLILIMLIYGLINFLFINNAYVLNRIKKQKNIEQQEYIKSNYWLPMRKFVRNTVWVSAGLMLLSIIIDIVTLLIK